MPYELHEIYHSGTGHPEMKLVTSLREGVTLIGRGESKIPVGHVRLSNSFATVSSLHCGVLIEGGRLRIIDLTSTNGTHVESADAKLQKLTPAELPKIEKSGLVGMDESTGLETQADIVLRNKRRSTPIEFGSVIRLGDHFFTVVKAETDKAPILAKYDVVKRQQDQANAPTQAQGPQPAAAPIPPGAYDRTLGAVKDTFAAFLGRGNRQKPPNPAKEPVDPG